MPETMVGSSSSAAGAAHPQRPSEKVNEVNIGDTSNGYNVRVQFERTSTGGRQHVAEFIQPKAGAMSKQQGRIKAKAKQSLWPDKVAAAREKDRLRHANKAKNPQALPEPPPCAPVQPPHSSFAPLPISSHAVPS